MDQTLGSGEARQLKSDSPRESGFHRGGGGLAGCGKDVASAPPVADPGLSSLLFIPPSLFSLFPLLSLLSSLLSSLSSVSLSPAPGGGGV